MNKTFLKVKIDTNKGYVKGYICLDDVDMFRQSNNDYNETIVDTAYHTYCIHMKFSDFAKIMLEHFNIK